MTLGAIYTVYIELVDVVGEYHSDDSYSRTERY